MCREEPWGTPGSPIREGWAVRLHWCIQVECAALDEARHADGGEELGDTSDAELCLRAGRDAASDVGVPESLAVRDLSANRDDHRRSRNPTFGHHGGNLLANTWQAPRVPRINVQPAGYGRRSRVRTGSLDEPRA